MFSRQDSKFDVHKKIYEDIPQEIAIYDRRGICVFLNKQFYTGKFDRSQFLDQDDAHYFEVMEIDNSILDKRKELFQKVLQEKKEIRFTEKFILSEKDKSLFYKRSYQPLFLKGSNRVSHIAFFGSNLTAIILSQKELKYLAYHDKLTGLGNRDAFNDKIDQMIREYTRFGEGDFSALLFCDLDNFNIVNDSLGHDIGDQLLVEVSKRIGLCLRKSDSIFRQGGDEFIVLLKTLKHSFDAGLVAEKIIQQLSKPYEIYHHTINYITASVGISLFPKDGTDRQQLASNAALALYEAKKRSKNTYKFFSEKLTHASKERLKIIKNLKQVINQNAFENHFRMVYQPIFKKTKNEHIRVVGSEALIRWNHPVLGEVSPNIFIPIAEESDLIQHFTDWILHRSLADYKYLKNLYPEPFYISINISPKQLKLQYLTDMLHKAIIANSLSPGNVQLEITETSIIGDEQNILSNLQRLEGMGFKLAIDDFGSGFASLSYLQKIPASVVKIDRSFVQKAQASKKDQDFLHAVILFCKHLEKDVIAEGIEGEAQINSLMKNQCYMYQGHFLSRPLPVVEFEEILQKNIALNTPS